MSPQGLRSIAEPNRSQAVVWACTSMQRTGHDWFGRSEVLLVFKGLRNVLFSLQIGFRLYGNQFLVEKGGDSLQTSGDLSVTDQRWGRGCKMVSKHVPIIRRWVCVMSPTCLCIKASFCHKYSQSSHQWYKLLIVWWLISVLSVELGRREEKLHNHQKIQLQHFDLFFAGFLQLQLSCC